jgi:metal-dependent amidase/aminoacylase/carboxypeptidase family protein
MPIRQGIIETVEKMRRSRRRLHAHPEAALGEHNTADFAVRLLTEWGIKVHRGLAITGVVSTLKVRNSLCLLGLHAGIDALDLDELNCFEYRSPITGKMLALAAS